MKAEGLNQRFLKETLINSRSSNFQVLPMEDSPKAEENYGGQLGFASPFRLGCEGGSPFFTSSTGLTCDFSRRGGSSSDHHIGESEERVELMPVLGEPSIPHLPMAE